MELICSATCPSAVNKGQIRQQSIWRMMLFCWTIDIFFHSNHRSFQNAPRDGRLSLSESDSVSHIKWDLFTFFWTWTLNGAPRREQFPLISRLRCRPLARLDPCVWWKVLFQHFCCHGRAEKAGDKQGKEAVVNNLQGDGGSTQHIQTETLNCESLCGLQAGGEIWAPAQTSASETLWMSLLLTLWTLTDQEEVLLRWPEVFD